MKQFNYVYKITNLINGKIYIGKHSTDNLDDNYMGSGKLLRLEYSACGRKNFEKTILAYSDDENELADLERHYITVLNATDPDVGYNRQVNSSRYSFTEEHNQKISKAKRGTKMSVDARRKMSEAHKGKESWNKGKHWSVETRQKMSESHKGKQIWLGKKHTETSKRKMSEAAKGRIPWNKGLKLKKESQI